MLLILDDLDVVLESDPEEAAGLIRALSSGHRSRLLVTSRWVLPGQVVDRLREIGRLDDAAAMVAFQQYAAPVSQWRVTESYQEDLRAILKFLDGYPLPIKLAATLMKRRHCSISDLRRDLIDSPGELLVEPGPR